MDVIWLQELGMLPQRVCQGVSYKGNYRVREISLLGVIISQQNKLSVAPKKGLLYFI